jgi:hypothetical protein
MARAAFHSLPKQLPIIDPLDPNRWNGVDF